MKTWIRIQISNGRRCIALTAYISKSKKHGIPQSVQKTWKIYCNHATAENAKPALISCAYRWQKEQMARWFSGRPQHVLSTDELI